MINYQGVDHQSSMLDDRLYMIDAQCYDDDDDDGVIVDDVVDDDYDSNSNDNDSSNASADC
jgi:hypothetical protein